MVKSEEYVKKDDMGACGDVIYDINYVSISKVVTEMDEDNVVNDDGEIDNGLVKNDADENDN